MVHWVIEICHIIKNTIYFVKKRTIFAIYTYYNMNIREANIINWITDILLYILFSPFIIVFFLTGFVSKFFYKLKFKVGSSLLRHVDNITYDDDEQKEDYVSQSTARETYVLIKEHLKEKKKAYDATTKLISDILNKSENKYILKIENFFVYFTR